MPTYEYQCKTCGRAFEAVQAFSDSPLTTCDICGGALKKVYGSVGIVFKGSGFYKTDNRSSSSTKPVADGATTSNGHDATPNSESKSSTPDSSPGATPSPAPAKKTDAAATK